MIGRNVSERLCAWIQHCWNLYSAVGILTRLRAGWSGDRIPALARGSSLLQKRPDRLWEALSLLFHGYRCSFSGLKWPGHECTTNLHLVLRLRMNAAINLLPPIFLHGVDFVYICKIYCFYFCILIFQCRPRCAVRTFNYLHAAGLGAP
jgi:hypothetical protein